MGRGSCWCTNVQGYLHSGRGISKAPGPQNPLVSWIQNHFTYDILITQKIHILLTVATSNSSCEVISQIWQKEASVYLLTPWNSDFGYLNPILIWQCNCLIDLWGCCWEWGGRKGGEAAAAGVPSLKSYAYTEELRMHSQRKLSCPPTFPEKTVCFQPMISALLVLQPLMMISMSNHLARDVANLSVLLSILALQMGETTNSENLTH